MNFLNRLEKHFGWMAIGHIPVYIVTAQAFLWMWGLFNPEITPWLTLEPQLVRYNHEYWRVLTFLFLTPFDNPIFTLLYLYFQYMCGVELEHEWGSFPLTLFYFVGAVGNIAAAFLVGGDMRGALFFNDVIFLAFAAMYPNFPILFFFIIPLKIKWIAWLTWARIGYMFFTSVGMYKVAILLSLANYFLFFGKRHYDFVVDAIRSYRHRQRYKENLQ